MGSPDPSSASDLNATAQVVHELRTVPMGRAAVMRLIVAAGIPMLAVVATPIPLAELVQWIVGKILQTDVVAAAWFGIASLEWLAPRRTITAKPSSTAVLPGLP